MKRTGKLWYGPRTSSGKPWAPRSAWRAGGRGRRPRPSPADSVRAHYDDAQQVLDGLRAVGADYDDLVQTLEDEGVSKFEADWEQLAERPAETLRSRPTR